MADAFDPYYKWLSIPPEEQPPHFYRLLGVKTFEADADVLENAADQRMSHLRSFQTGKHAAESQKLLNELAAARLCLLSPDKRQAYDRELKTKLAAEKPATAPAGAAAPASPAPVAKPLAAQPLVVARPVAAKPMAAKHAVPAAEPDSALGFDPLEQTPSRRPKKCSSNQSPAIYAGIGLGLIAVVAIAWIAVGGGDDRPIAAHDTKAPPKAKDTGSTGGDDTTPFQPAPQRTATNRVTDPVAADSEPAAAAIDSDASAEEPVEPGEPADDMADEMPVGKPDAEDEGDTSEPAIDDRPAPPDADAIAAAVVEIQRVLHDDFAAPKKSAEKIALAEKLIALVPDSSGASEQFALLSEARRLAIAASSPALALQVVDMLAESFAVDRFEQLANTADELATRDLSTAARKELVEAIEPLVEQALAAGQFAPGRRLAAAGLAAARKSNQNDITKILVRQGKELAAGEKLAASAADARAQLEKNSNDPKANETLGKYLCLYVHDWPAGLPYLAKADDPALRSVAELETAADPAPSAAVKVGDAWWGLAEHGGTDAGRMRARAGYWYEQAVSSLTGLTKTKIEKRLADLPAAAAIAAPKSVTARRSRFLSELGAQEIQTYYNTSITRDVVLAGVHSPHGIFMHPSSNSPGHVAYELGGRYGTLSGKVGVNDSAENFIQTGLIFRIVGDGKELWRSRPLLRLGDTQGIDVSVASIRRLELFVDCPGPDVRANAAWFEPQLTTAGKQRAAGTPTGKGKTQAERQPQERRADQPGKSRGDVTADKLVLWNCRNNSWKDRGTLSCNVKLRKADEVVWSKNAIPLAWEENEEPATTIPLPNIVFDVLRVEAVTYQGLGPALSEIEVFRGDKNIARAKPVTASGSHREAPLPPGVVDGIKDSSQLGAGYWIAPDHERAWIDVHVAAPAVASAKNPYLSDLTPIETRVRPSTALSHLYPLAGVTSQHGIFLHPFSGDSSHVAFMLDKKYGTLAGAAAICDTAGVKLATPLTFRIVADGIELWRATMQKAGAEQPVNVSVGGVNKLELFVDCPGNSDYAHAQWADLKLTRAGSRSAEVESTIVPPKANRREITITKAVFGLPGKQADVTERLQKAIGNAPFFAIQADDRLYGDPAPGEQKRLIVTGRIGTNPFSLNLAQSEVAPLPGFPAAGMRIPGASKDFSIVAAKYGGGTTWTDMTAAVAKIIHDTTTVFDAAEFRKDLPDPWFGVEKHVVIWFDHGGLRYVRVFGQSEARSLLP